jgi:hypothetical protein
MQRNRRDCCKHQLTGVADLYLLIFVAMGFIAAHALRSRIERLS